MGDFFAGPAEVGAATGKVEGLIKKIGGIEEGKGVEKWGGLGMCWGGKVGSLSVLWGGWFRG